MRVKTFLDLRLMLWLLALAVIGALAGLFFDWRFALAGLVFGIAGVGLILASLLCSVHACSTWLAEILGNQQGERPAQQQTPAATPSCTF